MNKELQERIRQMTEKEIDLLNGMVLNGYPDNLETVNLDQLRLWIELNLASNHLDPRDPKAKMYQDIIGYVELVQLGEM